MVDLSNYAIINIANYQTVTEIPQENIEYLSSGLAASNCYNMFTFCNKLEYIPWNEFNIDTSYCINMGYMFTACTALTSLNLSNFDTSKVTDMEYMFSGCKSLQEIICPNGFNMSLCTNVGYMFTECNSYSGEPLHFKNVPRNLDFSDIRGTEGVHYVIDSYKS